MDDAQISMDRTFEKILESIRSGLFDVLHTGVAFFSETGRFVYCNRAFRRMFKLPEDVADKPVTDYFPTGDAGEVSSLRTGKMVVCTSPGNPNAGSVLFRYPIYDQDEKFRGVLVETVSLTMGKDGLLNRLEGMRDLEMQPVSVHPVEEEAEGDRQPSRPSRPAAAMPPAPAPAKTPGGLSTFESIIGKSAPIERLRGLGRRFAQSHEPILITGESGTGKELVAQALHVASKRSNRPFVSVNCAALPHELMESELFGYEAGAFTGAKSGGMKGKFELADTGTIFLDEVGELPLTLQAKLLRVLESGEIQKIAHKGRLHSNFRLIGATNRNLDEMVRQGAFREDLFHRLSVFELYVPPLRERVDDIPLLVRYLISQSVGEARCAEIRIDEEVYRAFMRYPWRGNIRELKNTLIYALYALGDDHRLLNMQHLPQRFLRELRNASGAETVSGERTGRLPSVGEPAIPEMPEAGSKGRFFEAGAAAERRILWDALVSSRYNKVLAAKTLGISRSKLYRKLREYGMLEHNGN